MSLDGSLDEKTLIPLQRVSPTSLHLVIQRAERGEGKKIN